LKGKIPENVIEEIRNRTDIVGLISEYLTLKKAGKNFLGLCPFHQEKTPSFTVSREKQIFYCFGCGEGGNAITFLMKINNLSFPDAIRQLAHKTGIFIPERVLSRVEKEQADIRTRIKELNQKVANYYSEMLFSPEGQGAREYLLKRGIQEETAETFRLGYAKDGWRCLKDFIEKAKIPLQLAEQAGLIISKTDGGWYDRFRGRLMFPIEDVGKYVIAFGGRIIGDGEPKYLNSPESPVYTKGKILYGLNKTKEDIREKGYVILVEGYLDLISLWNSGIRNVVAALGTALTRDHVDLIKRYSKEVITLFDSDEAGKKAISRSLELFFTGEVNAKVVILPDGYDPDEYVRTFGREALETLIENAKSVVDYYIEGVMGNKKTVEDIRGAARESISFIGHIANPIERNLFIKRVSEKLGIDQELFKKEVFRLLPKRGKTSSNLPPLTGIEKSVDSLELNLVYMMLVYPQEISAIIGMNVLDYFMDGDLKNLGGAIKESYEKDSAMDATSRISLLPEGLVKQKLLKKIMEEGFYEEKLLRRMITDTTKQIRKRWYRQKHQNLMRKLAEAQEAGNMVLCDNLVAEKEKLIKEERNVHL
jgi:DNA primase